MRPYQFYIVKHILELKPGQTISNRVQLTLSGEDEKVRTTLKLEQADFDGRLARLQIESEIKHS